MTRNALAPCLAISLASLLCSAAAHAQQSSDAGAVEFVDSTGNRVRVVQGATGTNTAPPERGTERLCNPGQRSYFDERTQVYRQCPPAGAPQPQSAPRTSASAPADASPARGGCPAGARSEYDARTQQYRPCAAPANANQTEAQRAAAACRPGMRSFFDTVTERYIPCPSVPAVSTSSRASRGRRAR